MTRLALIRHGPTNYNAQRRIQGRLDVPLSVQGRMKVRAYRVPPVLDGFDWFSSPLARATETARLLAGDQVSIEERLLEMDWGTWEGRTLEELRTELGQEMQDNEDRGMDFRPEGGESPNNVWHRVQPFLADIAQGGRDTAAVTHKGVIRAVFAAATGWNMLGPPPQKLGWSCAHLFTVDEQGHPEVLAINLALTEKAPTTERIGQT